MKNKLFVPLLLSVAFAFPVAAQDTAPSPAGIMQEFRDDVRDSQQQFKQNVQEGRETLKTGIQQGREQLKTNIQQGKENLKTQTGALRDKAKEAGTPEARQQAIDAARELQTKAREEFSARREEFKADAQARRESFREDVAAKRDARKAELDAKKTELKDKLKAFRDEKKKQRVERLHERMNELQAKMLDRFTAALQKLEDVLGNIGSRADKAETNGYDVSAVRAAIASAQAAIDAARAAIAAQSGKVYDIPVTTEENAKADVGGTRQLLRADLEDIHQLVKAAQTAVRGAAEALKAIPRVDDLNVTPPVPEPSTTE